MEFIPAPYRAPVHAFAALVFPWLEDKIALANIIDRGWCIPSGRVEAGESSIEAVRREAEEEAGLTIDNIIYIGCYRLSEQSEVKWADVFVAEVKELGEITAPTESSGRQIVDPADLPRIYHLWTPLTEAVFKHSFEVLDVHRKLSH